MPSRKSDQRKSDSSVAVAVPSTAQPEPPLSSTDDRDGDVEKDKDGSKDKGKEKDKERDAVTIEDLTLPKSIITRLAKGVLPPNTQIQGNAILALSKSVTVFISYLASHANEHTTAAGKKTISPYDVLQALDDTEFSFLRGPLEAEFAKYNAVQTEKRTSYRQKVRAAKSDPASQAATSNDTAAPTTATGDDADTADTSGLAAPAAKKRRLEHSANSNTNGLLPHSGGETASGGADQPAVSPKVNGGGDETEEEDDDEDEDEEQDAEEEDEDQDEDEEEEEDDDDDEGNDDGEDDEDNEEEEEAGSGDDTQDALEERLSADEQDEALDEDESD